MTRKKAPQISFNYQLFIPLLIAAILLGILILYWSITKPFCANSRSCVSELRVENGASAVFNGQKITPPSIDLSETNSRIKVLGEATLTGEKHIYVDLTTQTLKAYQGDMLFMEVPVSTGKWHPTPTGEFTIWEKLRATRMSGGTGADYYDLPNVPYTMFFSGPNAAAGAGFSLHGAYWHNNFGHPMSHGCVNMRTMDAAKLYDWVNPVTVGSVTPATKLDPGTKITIYGQSPN